MNKKINSSDLERTAILELNSQYEYICHVHKVHLRPVGITLFDSTTLWGKFDPLTRTISISRKLINEHPWQHVVGVLMHEMAHQLVDEQYDKENTSKTSASPHSSYFKLACKRLGVPEQYTRAGLDFQNTSLDWRTETRNEAAEKILDKTKKLLSLGNSTNEHEAHLAMEKVRELYAKYNLEHIDNLTSEKFVHLVISSNKKRMSPWQQKIVSILLEHFFVKVLLLGQYNAKKGQTFQAIELIGMSENVLMAEYVYHFLLQQVEYLLKTVLKKNMLRTSAHKKSFRLGVLDGFDKKLKSTIQRAREHSTSLATRPLAKHKSNAGELTVVGQALDKFHSASQLDDYMNEIYPRLGRKKESATKVDRDAYSAGCVAGNSIVLKKPLASNSVNLGKFITS